MPSPTRTGLRLTRRMPELNRKTRAHQARVSLFRSRAGLWKKSKSRSYQAGSRSRARTLLVTPSRSLRVENPVRQRDIHRKVRVRAQADRNSHTRFHQWRQSMSGLLAGWLDVSVFGLDNCPGTV